jgi:hypothetical protein
MPIINERYTDREIENLARRKAREVVNDYLRGVKPAALLPLYQTRLMEIMKAHWREVTDLVYEWQHEPPEE